MSDIVADLILARRTGEPWMARYTGDRRYPTNREVAQRAYRLYEARGRVDGHALEDWLLAERELTWPYASSGPGACAPEDDLDAVSALRNASTLGS